MELYHRQRAERSEKTGVWGRIPRKNDELLTCPSDLDAQPSNISSIPVVVVLPSVL
jgi:hypothetical protein